MLIGIKFEMHYMAQMDTRWQTAEKRLVPINLLENYLVDLASPPEKSR